MGAGSSVEQSPLFVSFIDLVREYNRPLLLEELWKMEVPKFVRDVDFFSIAVLLEMDKDGDGRFSVTDLIAFGEMINSESIKFSEAQIGERINGLCVLNFTRNKSLQSRNLSSWILRLCTDSESETTGTDRVSRDTLTVVHKLLCWGSGRIRNMSFHDFYKVLSQCDKSTHHTDSVDGKILISMLDCMLDHYAALLKKALSQ